MIIRIKPKSLAYERSSGAIMFSIDKGSGEKEFLLLHYVSGHWDFPKGNIEAEEDELQTARREILEETGVQDVEFLKGFRKRYIVTNVDENQFKKRLFSTLVKLIQEKLYSLMNILDTHGRDMTRQ